MSLIATISGPYTAAWSTTAGSVAVVNDLGEAEGGFDVSYSPRFQDIVGTSSFADTVVDGVYRGVNVFLSTTLIEWTATSLAALTPWAALLPNGVDAFEIGQVGKLASQMAGGVVLTAVAGTPAAAKPLTLTALYAAVSNGHQVNFRLAPEQRKLPARWTLYPWEGGYGTPICFAVT